MAPKLAVTEKAVVEKKKKVVHYVDNKKFLEAMIVYKAEKLATPDNPPQIPEYIGECLLAIANKYSSRYMFVNYSFKQDMVADALENCILYLNNFDPEKSKNPFAYFTQIIHFAFIRRINKEKKQTYIKYKYAINQALIGEDYTTAAGDESDIKNPSWMGYENVQDTIANYEEKLAEKKRKRLVVEDEDTATLFELEPDTFHEQVTEEEKLDEDFSEDLDTELDGDEYDDGELPESLILNGEDID